MNRISRIIAFMRPSVAAPEVAVAAKVTDPDGPDCYFNQIAPRPVQQPAQTALEQMFGYYDAA
ncbi:MAG: Uncharacterized protein FD162_1303 [Rhodobacteraceae bacterium]|uniref:hypothetical protein n=1 Tax=Cypionkella sp. TaxID=2811411 RepID=UPI0013225F3D|nr:hypothetical protein [Cypionkella sp.]KAF0174068.1 MAG: Uncharacterized protein FD162_1303 [Paracoccaceae bacterium]MDO8326898.1 hypothetical protein [Cypionkella sp.]